MSASAGLLASYEYLDSTVDAIEGLKKAGFKPVSSEFEIRDLGPHTMVVRSIKQPKQRA